MYSPLREPIWLDDDTNSEARTAALAKEVQTKIKEILEIQAKMAKEEREARKHENELQRSENLLPQHDSQAGNNRDEYESGWDPTYDQVRGLYRPAYRPQDTIIRDGEVSNSPNRFAYRSPVPRYYRN